MRWPWVSRRRYEQAVRASERNHALHMDCHDQWAALLREHEQLRRAEDTDRAEDPPFGDEWW